MAGRQKNWILTGVAVTFDKAVTSGMDACFRDNFSYRISEFLESQNAALSLVDQEIEVLKLRRPYYCVSIELTPHPPGPPRIEKQLLGTLLLVPLQRDIKRLLDTPDTDKDLAEMFIGCVASGLERIGKDQELLRPAFEKGVAAIRAKNYVTQEIKPMRTRVVGADLLMEVSYDHSPTRRYCNIRFWRPGRPKVAFLRSFEVVPEPPARGYVRMYIYTPVQGAVRAGDKILLGETSWNDGPENGMTPTTAVADQAIALAEIEDVIGPVTRLDRSGRLRVID